MLSTEENALLCEVEPGTPMHEAFKRYWWPCGLSSDLPTPDSDPQRVTLLGEDYVMFRDSAGQVGVMRELCCHRGASLVLGRVEEGGIRCIYHGWKFDTAGTILDMPNCDDERFKTRYRQPAFPVREAGGLIWAYLGPAEHQPPFPHYPFFDLPQDHILISVPVLAANYIQVMEGGLDSSHLGVLHADTLKRGLDNGQSLLVKDLAPRMEAEDAEGGCRYAAIREVAAPDGQRRTLARVTAFALPAVTFLAEGTTMLLAAPIHSSLTYFYSIFWKHEAPFTAQEAAARLGMLGLDERGMKWGLGREHHGKPGTANRANNWLQDRAAMRAGETFTGIVDFVPEDAAVVESSGGVFDRRYENLVPQDMGLARVRRTLADNARRIQAGEPARGTDPNSLPYAAQGFLAAGQRWQDLPPSRGQMETTLETT